MTINTDAAKFPTRNYEIVMEFICIQPIIHLFQHNLKAPLIHRDELNNNCSAIFLKVKLETLIKHLQLKAQTHILYSSDKD